jgi:hypothetical protein
MLTSICSTPTHTSPTSTSILQKTRSSAVRGDSLLQFTRIPSIDRRLITVQKLAGVYPPSSISGSSYILLRLSLPMPPSTSIHFSSIIPSGLQQRGPQRERNETRMTLKAQLMKIMQTITIALQCSRYHSSATIRNFKIVGVSTRTCTAPYGVEMFAMLLPTAPLQLTSLAP